MAKFNAPCYVNPQYELVALHPEHFLPNGSPLTVYDRATREYKNYVAARDRCLRETADPGSHRLPPFYHDTELREDDGYGHLNVYLVTLNAEIKFRRYLEMVNARPPATPLPDHILSLMDRTIELVNLIYWRPTLTKGSKGERILIEKHKSRRKDPGRASRPDPAKTIERGSSKEMDEEDDLQIASNISAPSQRHRKFDWPEGMDQEARMAYARALMSGHGMLYFLHLYRPLIIMLFF